MAYALGTPVGSGCGCSTGTTAADILKSLDIPGLMLHDARSSDLYIDQGATQESVICYMSGMVSPEVSCIKKDGTLQFGSEAKLCFKKDDLVRILNFDDCKADSGEIYQLVADPVMVGSNWEFKLQATPANAAALPPVAAGPSFIDAISKLPFDSSNTHCFTGSVNRAPIGCVQTVKKSSSAPRLMLHIPGTKLALSGAVSSRDDYYDEFGVSTDGTDWISASAEVAGRVKIGDFITSPDASINTPIRILQVRKVEVRKSDNSGNEFIERWQVERKVATVECALVYIRRGTSMQFEIVPDGDCSRIIIPGSMTSGLQLPAEWKTADGYYDLGRYTITASWGVLRNGKLAPRTEVIKSGRVMLRPTHHFSSSKFA